jgi:DNA-binding CsgD family transcriptional regulator
MLRPLGIPRSDLVGRGRELARLEALVLSGGAVVVEGPPGVGKSALLAAVDPGAATVHATTGVETELDLPFAGLAELLGDLLPHLDALPDRQCDALRGALALGEPTGDDRVVILHAVAGLVAAAAAAEGPVVLVVDDVQWLDSSSEEAVGFVARRAARLGAAVVAVHSLRGTGYRPWADVARLRLGDLGRADAVALARGQGLAAPVAEALVDAVGGNPLALVEAPGELSPEQRGGVALLPELLPVGQRLVRDYADRVAALPAVSRRALLLAAATGDGATAPVLAALGDDAASAFAAAEDDGLVAVDPRTVRFAHPLVRSAVYHAASPTQRREAHRALAAVTSASARAWHLAVAADAPDEELAAALEQLGYEASGRGAPATAVSALERAALLSEDEPRTVARTLAAAGIAMSAGRPARALALLDPLVDVPDPAARADVQLLRGMAMQQTGRPLVANALLEDEAARIADADPGRGAALLTAASLSLISHGPLDRILALADRALALAPAGMELPAAILRADALVCLGRHAEARAALDALSVPLATVDPTGSAHELMAVSALCRIYLGDYADAERQLEAMVSVQRARGALGALAFPVAVQATLEMRRSRFASAAALADEAVSVGEDSVGPFTHSLAVAAVAMIAAHVGDEERCLPACAQMLARGGELGMTTTIAIGEEAQGLLRLGQGRLPEALAHFERGWEHVQRFGARDPAFFYTLPHLIETLVRLGRAGDALPYVARLEADAALAGSGWAIAIAARCRAFVADDEQLDDLLATALGAHATLEMPFELARTQLAFGERLRRARRRADARALLTEAQASFAAMGATPWVTRAERELAATGVRQGGDTAPDDLTPREREVCALVAAGATNREVAATLYLSERTVEHHLRQSYRKLGVRSRSELAGRWSTAAAD